ncbi:hypothetical protein KS4_01780 [Poriferisphaera corsica]|uniref:Uncharacterized protein n=1 Tax=Poriferisphaera corsica TaxID=2528020 RepID=A0A517YPK2_9BACT|nr:hypothetical protein [Poriferisphaera corsica]QDU32149.1 hypothetical protein KS4_01780 [Poriferisphaera corsica]
MKLTSLLSLLMMVVFFVGCSSLDRHVYESTPTSLKTITVVKKPSGEPIWSYDVPSGYRLVMDFNTDEQVSNKANSHSVIPTQMSWKLIKGDEDDLTGLYMMTHAEESDVVALPGTPIQMVVSLRSASGEEELMRKYEIDSSQEVLTGSGEIESLEKANEDVEGEHNESNDVDFAE